MTYPPIIQGGMGIGVSGWRLAGAVGRAGGLGVVSGVALDTMLARRLQDGDRDGHLRQALSRFPVAEIANRVLCRYFIRGGRASNQPYRAVPRLTLQPSPERQRLAVVAAFVEIHLARQAARGAQVGINFLEKIQLATPAAAYGAMLAGVDVVLVGAGIPARLPSLLDALSRHRRVEFPVDVAGAGQARYALDFDPVTLLGRRLPALLRPLFLAIVSSSTLAAFLARGEQTRPDGFVVEAAIAGGHNAPLRGTLRLDGQGNLYTARRMPQTQRSSSRSACRSGLPAAARGRSRSRRPAQPGRAAFRSARCSLSPVSRACPLRSANSCWRAFAKVG